MAGAGPCVRYVHEDVPGIAAGRARAVDEAGTADLLVFIDDDEVPTPELAGGALATWQSLRSAGRRRRQGVADLHGVSDPWIDAGGFFVRPRRTTGSLVAAASSANLLLDLRVLRRLGIGFDRGLGMAGGEDTMVTRQLTDAGERLVWCHEAEVIDVIPPAADESPLGVEAGVQPRCGGEQGHARAFPAGIARASESGSCWTVPGGRPRALPWWPRRLLVRRERWQARGARLACSGRRSDGRGAGRRVVEYRRSTDRSAMEVADR